jgi:hypothetical protein
MQGFDHKSNFLSQVLQDFLAEISNDYINIDMLEDFLNLITFVFDMFEDFLNLITFVKSVNSIYDFHSNIYIVTSSALIAINP